MHVCLCYIPRLRELDAAIDIANAYIKVKKEFLRNLLENENHFDQALKKASLIKIYACKLELQTFARTIVAENHTEIH